MADVLFSVATRYQLGLKQNIRMTFPWSIVFTTSIIKQIDEIKQNKEQYQTMI